MLIRQETTKDYKATEHVVEEAFRDAEFADHAEHLLVQRLRESESFIPEVSLVAEIEGEIVGHILFTKIIIIGEKIWDSISLAPVSVLPKHQRKGIGGELILKGLEIVKHLGFESVIVLGHEEYYPKFGFQKASSWSIKCPFDVPEGAFMAIELKPGALTHVVGTVEYPKEFGI